MKSVRQDKVNMFFCVVVAVVWRHRVLDFIVFDYLPHTQLHSETRRHHKDVASLIRASCTMHNSTCAWHHCAHSLRLFIVFTKLKTIHVNCECEFYAFWVANVLHRHQFSGLRTFPRNLLKTVTEMHMCFPFTHQCPSFRQYSQANI